MTKTCWKCGHEKAVSEFYPQRRAKDGLQRFCKPCGLAIGQARYQANKEKLRPIYVERSKQWAANNRERYKEIVRRSNARQRAKNPERIRAAVSKWAKSNRSRINARKRELYRSNPKYATLHRLRNRLIKLLRKSGKSESVSSLLGCSTESFRTYFESRFEPGMTWEAFLRGEIHIDHIVPCALFDLTKPEHRKVAFHFSNLQPLWAVDNLRKSDTPPPVHQFNLL